MGQPAHGRPTARPQAAPRTHLARHRKPRCPLCAGVARWPWDWAVDLGQNSDPGAGPEGRGPDPAACRTRGHSTWLILGSAACRTRGRGPLTQRPAGPEAADRRRGPEARRTAVLALGRWLAPRAGRTCGAGSAPGSASGMNWATQSLGECCLVSPWVASWALAPPPRRSPQLDQSRQPLWSWCLEERPNGLSPSPKRERLGSMATSREVETRPCMGSRTCQSSGSADSTRLPLHRNVCHTASGNHGSPYAPPGKTGKPRSERIQQRCIPSYALPPSSPALRFLFPLFEFHLPLPALQIPASRRFTAQFLPIGLEVVPVAFLLPQQPAALAPLPWGANFLAACSVRDPCAPSQRRPDRRRSTLAGASRGRGAANGSVELSRSLISSKQRRSSRRISPIAWSSVSSSSG